jgi:DNA recombination protein RmuC
MELTLASLIIILVVTIAAHVGVAWYFHRSGQEGGSLSEKLNDLSRQLNQQIGEQTRTMDNKLTKTVESQFGQSRKLIQNITKEIQSVKETNKDVLDITESLKNLEQVLKNQTKRGSLGEASLNLILENLLPPNAFVLQYSFADGKRPDAIIKAKDGIIPIDAKFPLSNYQRLLDEEDKDKREGIAKDFKNDLKKRIDETAKYIQPKEENTLSFALMYIPAEGVYYDLLVNQVGTAGANSRNLIEYAHEKSVIVVSPTTLAAYLHTILQGLRAFRIEKNTERIQEGVESLRNHLRAYEDVHGRLGSNLNAVVNQYDESNVKLRGIGRDIRKITDGDFEIDGVDVENPKLDGE